MEIKLKIKAGLGSVRLGSVRFGPVRLGKVRQVMVRRVEAWQGMDNKLKIKARFGSVW
jgi:hypothetical protein